MNVADRADLSVAWIVDETTPSKRDGYVQNEGC
jgi:hypothetical protein